MESTQTREGMGTTPLFAELFDKDFSSLTKNESLHIIDKILKAKNLEIVPRIALDVQEIATTGYSAPADESILVEPTA